MKGTFRLWYEAYKWASFESEDDGIFTDDGWVLIAMRGKRVKYYLLDCRQKNPSPNLSQG